MTKPRIHNNYDEDTLEKTRYRHKLTPCLFRKDKAVSPSGSCLERRWWACQSQCGSGLASCTAPEQSASSPAAHTTQALCQHSHCKHYLCVSTMKLKWVDKSCSSPQLPEWSRTGLGLAILRNMFWQSSSEIWRNKKAHSLYRILNVFNLFS